MGVSRFKINNCAKPSVMNKTKPIKGSLAKAGETRTRPAPAPPGPLGRPNGPVPSAVGPGARAALTASSGAARAGPGRERRLPGATGPGGGAGREGGGSSAPARPRRSPGSEPAGAQLRAPRVRPRRHFRRRSRNPAARRLYGRRLGLLPRLRVAARCGSRGSLGHASLYVPVLLMNTYSPPADCTCLRNSC